MPEPDRATPAPYAVIACRASRSAGSSEDHSPSIHQHPPASARSPARSPIRRPDAERPRLLGYREGLPTRPARAIASAPPGSCRIRPRSAVVWSPASPDTTDRPRRHRANLGRPLAPDSRLAAPVTTRRERHQIAVQHPTEPLARHRVRRDSAAPRHHVESRRRRSRTGPRHGHHCDPRARRYRPRWRWLCGGLREHLARGSPPAVASNASVRLHLSTRDPHPTTSRSQLTDVHPVVSFYWPAPDRAGALAREPVGGRSVLSMEPRRQRPKR